jgi:hypothetical protein
MSAAAVAMESTTSTNELHTVLIMPPSGLRNALALSLWDQGMVVTAFGTLPEAEAILSGVGVQCVVLDDQLGLDVLAPLMAWLHNRGKQRVTVVVMGDAAMTWRPHLSALGIHHVVPRPAQPARWAVQLASALGMPANRW